MGIYESKNGGLFSLLISNPYFEQTHHILNKEWITAHRQTCAQKINLIFQNTHVPLPHMEHMEHTDGHHH